MKKQLGFTLIEVMIVVVIVAILAAVAIPSYQDSVRKTRRADAKEALTSAAALQERYFFTHNTYAATHGTLGIATDSTEGYYTIIFADPDNMKGSNKVECEVGTSVYPCFKLVASPKVSGAQASDTQCNQLTVTHSGKRQAFASDGTTDTTDSCW